MIIFANSDGDIWHIKYPNVELDHSFPKTYTNEEFKRKFELSLDMFDNSTTMIEPNGALWSAYKLKSNETKLR